MPPSQFQFDSEYLRSWRDLRRREVLFWLVVLSYAPGILLIIWIMTEIHDDVHEHMFAFLSAAWIAAFVAAAAYRQRFRCPRCGQLFFRRLIGYDPDSRKCLSCGLPRWAFGPLIGDSEKLHRRRICTMSAHGRERGRVPVGCCAARDSMATQPQISTRTD